MTAIQQRLNFVREYLSLSQISVMTTIPTSTLSAYSRGTQSPSLPRQRQIRNLYQRTAYAELRATGLSATQARRFSWYRPDRIREVLQQTGSLVDMLSRSRFDQYKESLQRRGLYVSDDQTMQTLRDAIEQAIRNSELPQERLVTIQYGNTVDL